VSEEPLTGSSGSAPLIEWGVAARTLPGEEVSGDLYIVHESDSGVLVGVVDALGHGKEAEMAATLAVAMLEQFAHEPLMALLQRCHQALIGTRGVVMSLAWFGRADRTVIWLGIGDVEGQMLFADPNLQPSKTTLVTRGGIVGARLPVVRPWVIPVSAGDVLIFSTDGIRSGYVNGAAPTGPPQRIADQILARFGKTTDDALVLVARYLPEGGGQK
jgi:negative regulator of sigma-B (phosphoserine phosphatase)